MLYLCYKAKNNAKKGKKKRKKTNVIVTKKNEFKKEAIKVVLKKF